MAQVYRFYPITASGTRLPPEDAMCDDDEAAILWGRRLLLVAGAVEIWLETAMIGVVV